MKHIKLFEDFKDSTSSKADELLKQIEKVTRYNLTYGSLHKKGFTYENSDIYDDKGPYDWLKMEVYQEKEKTEYRYNLIFMLDEEYFAEDAKAGEEKVHIEINKYKLPEYKRIAGLKKDFPLQEVFHDDFLVKEIEEVDKKVLKTPKDEKDYLDNLKNQEEQAKTEIETPTEEGGEETETAEA